MKFKIESRNKKGFIKFENYNDFIKDSFQFWSNDKNENVVLLVTYNNFDDLKSLLVSFVKEKIAFDLVIVDNNSQESKVEDFLKFLKKLNLWNKKIYYLKLTDNLGWGGWYSVWLEFILKKNKYKYLILTEDDAFPLQENTISTMLSNSWEDIELFIKHVWSNTKSITFHFHWLPIDFVKYIWVVDPRFFMRADDWEYDLRKIYAFKEKKLKEKILSIYYTHPVIKPENNKYWQIYFWQRNNLIAESRWKIFPKYSTIVFFLYVWLSIFFIFRYLNFDYLKVIFYALIDFILIRYNYDINRKRLNTLKTKNLFLYNKNILNEDLTFDEFNRRYGNYYLFPVMWKSVIDRNFKYSKKIGNFFKIGIMFFWFSNPLYQVASLSPSILSIEDIDFLNKKIKVSLKTNKLLGRLLNLVALFLSFLVVVVVIILILPILLIRYLISYFFKI